MAHSLTDMISKKQLLAAMELPETKFVSIGILIGGRYYEERSERMVYADGVEIKALGLCDTIAFFDEKGQWILRMSLQEFTGLSRELAIVDKGESITAHGPGKLR